MPSGWGVWPCRPPSRACRSAPQRRIWPKPMCVLSCSRCAGPGAVCQKRGRRGSPPRRGRPGHSQRCGAPSAVCRARTTLAAGRCAACSAHNTRCCRRLQIGPIRRNGGTDGLCNPRRATQRLWIAGPIAQSARQRWEGRLQTAAQRLSMAARDFTHRGRVLVRLLRGTSPIRWIRGTCAARTWRSRV